jgi:glutamate synthase (NADPH/NADH) small chain
MQKEGVIFKTNIEIGKQITIEQLKKEFDIVLLCTGATIKRNLPIKGQELSGVIQAMDFLKKQNLVVDSLGTKEEHLNAKNKNVIVIGGGDTGSDCIGTSVRQGAKSITNFEIMPKPSKTRTKDNPWPYWPFTLKSSSSHDEGSNRKWSIMTKEFIGNKEGKLTGLKTVEVEWITNPEGEKELVEKQNSEKIWDCDLVLLALGFTGPEDKVLAGSDIKIDSFNKPITSKYMTSDNQIFAAGDNRRGQSLIVWAISEGREAAYEIDKLLMGATSLRTKLKGDLVK